MIEDIQVFSSIYHNEDTKVEYFADAAVCLSQVDCINENSWPEWINADPKTDISLKSGMQITVMAEFKNVLFLWKRFRKANEIANLVVKNN